MEYIMLTLTSITKNMLFRMCSPIIWFHMNWNTGKPTYKFAQTCCIAFLPYTGSDSTYCLWYLVLHVHEQQFNYVGHNTGNDCWFNMLLILGDRLPLIKLDQEKVRHSRWPRELCVELKALYFSSELFWCLGESCYHWWVWTDFTALYIWEGVGYRMDGMCI